MAEPLGSAEPRLKNTVLESPFYYAVIECNVFGNLIKYILSKIDHIKTAFGLIHTRHFRSQYCDKKIFFSSKYCSYISKSFQINRKKYFQFTQWKKKYWLKNVFLSFYRNIAILCVKISRMNKAFTVLWIKSPCSEYREFWDL